MSKQNKLCISIRGFKRPDYSKRCLDSLEANSDLTDVDFYFTQDGAVNPFSGVRYATDEQIKDSLKVFEESKLPNKTIFQSRDNLGAALRNQHQLNILFPKYEYVVMADNDLIFNKYYIKTLKTLFRQFEGSDAGSIQTSFKHNGRNFQSLENAENLQDKVAYGFSHRWEIGLWRESWNKIRPFIAPYFEIAAKCDFKKLLYDASVYENIREQLRDVYGAHHGKGGTTTEDYAFEKSILRAGYKGLHTLTLRHKTIGERGMYSFRSSRFKDGKYGRIKLYNVGDVDKYEVDNQVTQ